MATPSPAPRFDRVLVLRAYAMFIDALAATLVAAPMQWVLAAADEMALYWVTFGVMNVAMMREFDGTFGMKLLGLVALHGHQRPAASAMVARLLLAYLPAIAGFALATRLPYTDGPATVAPALVALSIAEWVRATVRFGAAAPPAPFWDRLTGIQIIRV